MFSLFIPNTIFNLFTLYIISFGVAIYIKKCQTAVYVIFYYRYIKIYLMATEVGRQAMFPTHYSLLAAA